MLFFGGRLCAIVRWAWQGSPPGMRLETADFATGGEREGRTQHHGAAQSRRLILSSRRPTPSTTSLPNMCPARRS